MSDEKSDENKAEVEENTESSQQTEDLKQTEDYQATEGSTENNNSSETSDRSENQTEVIDEMDALNAEQLIAKVKETQQKADENWDMALRSKAEMDNVRRRTEKDVANARKFGIEKLANELLPIKDSMELGIKAAKETESNDEANTKIIEGMDMTLKLLVTAMDKVGIKEISANEGDAFNPEIHQAMTMQEIEGKESNTLVSVFQKGYTLNDRLLRAAMVLVAK